MSKYRLSSLIAKLEDGVSKAITKTNAAVTEVVRKSKIEVRASRIAEGAAEEARLTASLESPLHGIDAAQRAMEAVAIHERAEELLNLRNNRAKIKEHIRKVKSGEIKLP